MNNPHTIAILCMGWYGSLINTVANAKEVARLEPTDNKNRSICFNSLMFVCFVAFFFLLVSQLVCSLIDIGMKATHRNQNEKECDGSNRTRQHRSRNGYFSRSEHANSKWIKSEKKKYICNLNNDINKITICLDFVIYFGCEDDEVGGEETTNFPCDVVCSHYRKLKREREESKAYRATPCVVSHQNQNKSFHSKYWSSCDCFDYDEREQRFERELESDLDWSLMLSCAFIRFHFRIWFPQFSFSAPLSLGLKSSDSLSLDALDDNSGIHFIAREVRSIPMWNRAQSKGKTDDGEEEEERRNKITNDANERKITDTY